MLSTVFLKSLYDQRRSLLGWSIGVTALVWIEAALWPTVDGMADFDKLLADYPEALKKLFDVDAMSTGQGFMNAELYTLMLPILFIVFAVGRGARLTAGDEQQGSLDIILVTPRSRSRILLEQAAALVVTVMGLGLVLIVSMVSASAVFALGVDFWSAATGALAMVLLGIEFGCVGLALGAATGRRAIATAGAGGLAVVAYVLYVAAQFVDQLSEVSDWSPMDQAMSEGPLGAGLQPSYLSMALVSAGIVLVALPAFSRRDIPAH